MDTLTDSPLIPASILFSIPSAHPPTQGSGSFLLCLAGYMWYMAYGFACFLTSHAPVRTGHLAKERPISWSLSFYLYSWLSGLVQLLFPLFMVLGGHGFVLWTVSFGTLFWSNLLSVTASFVVCSCLLP